MGELRTMRNKGAVQLIGAGPGAPDLISLRGLRALREAQAVVMDALLPPDFLAQLGIVNESLELVRLACGKGRQSQDQINQMLWDLVQRFDRVVRLKGGDPGVFGRVTEETEFLTNHGIAWDVIPGPSNCTAVFSSMGRAATRRTSARSLAAVTAREVGGVVADNWPRADTLVVFMGVRIASDVADALIADGWSSDTPCAIVARASQPGERRWHCSLGQLGLTVRLEKVQTPALLIVGHAASQPQDSRATILVASSSPGAHRLLGDVTHWPALAVHSGRQHRANSHRLALELRAGQRMNLCFLAAHSVHCLMNSIAQVGGDARSLAGSTLAAADGETSAALGMHGVSADIEGGDWLLRSARAAAGKGPKTVLVGGKPEVRNASDVLVREQLSGVSCCTHAYLPHPVLARPIPNDAAVLYTSEAQMEAWSTAYASQLPSAIWVPNVALQSAAARLFPGVPLVIFGPSTREEPRRPGTSHLAESSCPGPGAAGPVVSRVASREAS